VVFPAHARDIHQFHQNGARMYEGDSWYNAFVPRTAAKPQEKAKHRRRESLLKQPNVSPPSAAWVRPSILMIVSAGDSG
jgi:hypothetical protein